MGLFKGLDCRQFVIASLIAVAGCGSGDGAPKTGRENVGATSAGLSSCDTRSSQVWAATSDFSDANGWFDTSSRERVWLADASGDGIADMIGISFGGVVLVAEGTGTGFAAPTIWGSTMFDTPDNWFTNTYRQRVWAVDVNNDHKADLVGISDSGIIVCYLNNGTGFAAPTLVGSVFAATGGWLDPPGSLNPDSNTRLWLSDTNGDGFLDVVGISNFGTVWVSPGNSSGFGETVGPFNSAFSNPGGWFNGASNDRVWSADVDGDHASDLIGIDANGQIQVSFGAPGGGTPAFSPTMPIGLPTMFTSSMGWFDRSGGQPRVWVADITGDGAADVLGIAPPGEGDGDVWVAKSLGSARNFYQRPWLFDSRFKTGDGWFDSTSQPRIFLSDVTGDHRVDLVGIDTNGDIWAAKAAPEAEGGLLPMVRTTSSTLTDASGIFDTSHQRQIWLADVTNDGLSDIVAVSPSLNDGDITWTSVYPTSVQSITPISRAQVTAGQAVPVQVGFSRSMNCSSLPASTLSVKEQVNGGAVTPLTVTAASPAGASKSCTFNVSLQAAASSADVKISKTVQGVGLPDRWNQPTNQRWVDGNGDGFSGCATDGAARIDYLSDRLVAGAGKIRLDYNWQATGVQPRFPAADGDGYANTSPAKPFQVMPGAPPITGRVVLLGKGTSDVLALVSVEFVGVNPGRLRDLIAARTGIARQNVLISATHSHTVFHTANINTAPTFDDRSWPGPAPTLYNYPVDDPSQVAVPRFYPYLQWAEDTLAEQVATVYASLVPVTVGVGETNFPTVSNPPTNRCDCSSDSDSDCDLATKTCLLDYCGARQFDRDPTIGTIALYSASTPLAMLVNYATHPVILSEALGMNTDFPGFMSECLESGCASLASTYPKFPVGMFIQAGAGDINPGGTWSDNEALSREYGRTLAQAVLDVAAPVGFQKATNGMAVRSIRSTQHLSGAPACSDIDKEHRPNCTIDNTGIDNRRVDWEPETTSLVVGPPTPQATPLFAFSTMPGEPYSSSQIALHTTAVTGNARTFLFGYTNGYYGYLPDSPTLNCADTLAKGTSPNATPADEVQDRTGSCGYETPTPAVPDPPQWPYGVYGIDLCWGPGFLQRDPTNTRTAGDQLISQALTSLNTLYLAN